MNKGFQKSWLLILVTMCLLFTFGFLGYIPFFAEHEYFLSAIGELSLILPVALGIKLLRTKNTGNYLKKGFSPSFIPILVLIPFCMQTFIMTVAMPGMSLLYELFGDLPNDVGNAASAKEFLLQTITVCIIPAVMEELLCRGVIMDMMKPYGIAAAMAVSALGFAMLHFSICSLPVIFMMGLLFAAVRILTGSIWTCVLVHFSNNFLSLAVGYIPDESVALTGVITAFAVILFPVLIMRLLKRTHAELLTDTKTKHITFSPEMCICMGIFIVTAFI